MAASRRHALLLPLLVVVVLLLLLLLLLVVVWGCIIAGGGEPGRVHAVSSLASGSRGGPRGQHVRILDSSRDLYNSNGFLYIFLERLPPPVGSSANAANIISGYRVSSQIRRGAQCSLLLCAR